MLESNDLTFINPEAISFCSKNTFLATNADLMSSVLELEEENKSGNMDAEKILFPETICSYVLGTCVISLNGVRNR